MTNSRMHALWTACWIRGEFLHCGRAHRPMRDAGANSEAMSVVDYAQCPEGQCRHCLNRWASQPSVTMPTRLAFLVAVRGAVG